MLFEGDVEAGVRAVAHLFGNGITGDIGFFDHRLSDRHSALRDQRGIGFSEDLNDDSIGLPAGHVKQLCQLSHAGFLVVVSVDILLD